MLYFLSDPIRDTAQFRKQSASTRSKISRSLKGKRKKNRSRIRKGYYSTVELRGGTAVKRALPGEAFRQNEVNALGHLDKNNYPDSPKALQIKKNRIKTRRVKGLTLQEEIDRGISPGRQKKIGRSLSQALTRLHDIDVSHGDLNPRNIVVSRRGRAKLIDYGYASIGKSPSMNMFDYKYLLSEIRKPGLRVLRKEVAKGVKTERLTKTGVRIIKAFS